MSETSAEITVSPEIQRLEPDCQLLREEVARLLAEAHDLISVVKANLLAIYQDETRRMGAKATSVGMRDRPVEAQDLNDQASISQSRVRAGQVASPV